MSGWSLDKTAERFDDLYTRMTGLQRRLIEAVRSGDESDPRTRELVEEARTVIAACDAAGRAMGVGYSAREVEDRALRARVLRAPLDPVLVMAAARSQSRPYGYRLLADALALTATRGDDPATVAISAGLWGERTVLNLLGAPQSMGEFRARRVAEHIGITADTPIDDLDENEHTRLVAGLRECADELPESAGHPRGRPKLPADAATAGKDILDRWIEESGTGTDPIRQAARRAAQRDGWPPDGVAAAELLVAFTGEKLMPHVVPDFEVLAAETDFEQRIAAMRAEERSYRHRWQHLSETEEERQAAFDVAFGLREYIDAVRAAVKARQLVELPAEQWRSGSPLSNARTAARRCGGILAGFTEDAVALLDTLPPETDR